MNILNTNEVNQIDVDFIETEIPTPLEVFVNGLSNLSPGNEAVEHIREFVQFAKYREGNNTVQHQRYVQEEIWKACRLILKEMGRGFFPIRTTDISKRPQSLPEERAFDRLCGLMKAELGKFNPDPARKNLFPDLERGGFLERDKRGRTIKYCRLTRKAIQFATTEDTRERNSLWHKFIRKLLQELPNNLNAIFDKLGTTKVSLLEMALFVCKMDNKVQTDFFDAGEQTSLNKCIRLLEAWHNIPISCRENVEIEFKELEKGTKEGIKNKDKKDWHNFLNPTIQQMNLLGQLPEFEYDNELNVLYKFGHRVNGQFKFEKSRLQSRLWMKFNEIEIKDGRQLHHIFEMDKYGRIEETSKLYDDWRTQLLVDPRIHATWLNSGEYTKLSFNGNNVVLTSPSGKSIELEYEEHVWYHPKNKQTFLEYNQMLSNLK